MFVKDQGGNRYSGASRSKIHEAGTPDRRSSPYTSCILEQTCDQYRMVNIIPFILGGADGSTNLLYRQRGYVSLTATH